MVYVIDTSVVSALHRNYYKGTFKTLWNLFDEIVEEGRITSTREVFRELDDGGGSAFVWAKGHKDIFAMPDAKEGGFVAKIFSVPHFQQNIEKQKLLKGGNIADPFLIARAHAVGGTVLTMEQLKPNSAKIPNICEHFRIRCVDLEGFMKREKWEF